MRAAGCRGRRGLEGLNGLRVLTGLIGLMGLLCGAGVMAGEMSGEMSGKLAGKMADGTRAERVLDDLRDLKPWTASASDQVRARIAPASKAGGLCLHYDFAGVSGYAVARRELPVQWPAHPSVQLRWRGSGGPNTVQIKWVDASGDNVWWNNRSDAELPERWQPLRIPAHRIDFAWGPSADKTLRETRYMEIVAVAGKAGGRGQVCVDDIRLQAQPPAPAVWPEPRRTEQAQGWQWDLGQLREFSGLQLQWADPARRAYRVQVSSDARDWQTVREVREAAGPFDALYLPDTRARWLRLVPAEARPGLQAPELGVVDVRGPGAWSSEDDALKARAARAARGDWPRAYRGEQNFWTVLGVDGAARHSALVSEDGAIELGVAGPSLEPALLLDYEDGRQARFTWADVQAEASLPEGDLPLPRVQWRHADFVLDIDTAAFGSQASPQALARYRVTPVAGRGVRRARLLLQLRPLQVNPPQQFLNTPGGSARLWQVRWTPEGLKVNDHWHLASWPRAVAMTAASADLGPLRVGDEAQQLSRQRPLFEDPARAQAQALLVFDSAAPGTAAAAAAGIETRPGHLTVDLHWGLRGQRVPAVASAAQADRWLAQARQSWRQRLQILQVEVPAADPRLLQTLRTSLAHMLVSRQGPALQPGTRAYARTWIRDGAMMVSGLSRVGEQQVSRAFVDWFSTKLFANGKVPCCHDHRGSDPVVENDSHGQYIFAVAELWRHRQPGDGLDAAWLQGHWHKVLRVVRYMDRLRAQQSTPGMRAAQGMQAAFVGVMPKSISHEGYSAQPMHSYWDNFWALRGYKDALYLAQAAGQTQAQRHLQQALADFERDLAASLRTAMAHHRIDHLPGAAELGDFDATSTTVALDPAQAQRLLPEGSLAATFERYWQVSQARARGQRDWVDYTPYELRTVGALVRLGQRERAWDMLDFFFADQRPAGWRQWAEVVMREPRRVHFLGDMPHAWVSSDFLRAALDVFWHEREQGPHDIHAVLGAGWPAAWWRDGRIRLSGLQTRWGRLALDIEPEAGGWRLQIAGLKGMPAGALRLSWPGDLPRPQLLDSQGRAEPGEWQPQGSGFELALPAPDAQGRLALRLRQP